MTEMLCTIGTWRILIWEEMKHSDLKSEIVSVSYMYKANKPIIWHNLYVKLDINVDIFLSLFYAHQCLPKGECNP